MAFAQLTAIRRLARGLREAIGEASLQLPLPGGYANISFARPEGLRAPPRIVDGHITVDRRRYGPRADGAVTA